MPNSSLATCSQLSEYSLLTNEFTVKHAGSEPKFIIPINMTPYGGINPTFDPYNS